MSDSARIETDDGYSGTLDDQGRLVIDTPDGGTLYRINWKRKRTGGARHDENLAETLDSNRLYEVADDLLREIAADDMSRREYLESLAKAIEMLGIRLEDAISSGADSTAPLPGMSSFRHPLLLQAAIRFQADFVAELLPTDGPVKVRDDTPEAPEGQPGLDNLPVDLAGFTSADLAEALQKDLNHYLTATASEYVPDTTRMAFWVGLMGGGFKKVYHCKLRKRPVSESIDVNDLIVDHSATDLRNAARVTHRILMRHSKVRRMVKAGVYRDVSLGQAMQVQDPVEAAQSRATGIAFVNTLPSDHLHTFYETAVELDLEDDDYLPYKVTVDKDSREIMAIYRNWSKDDKLKLARQEIVKFSYLDALGFYPLGLIHILGNTVRALTAAFREFLDAGMFANFPGFLYSAEAGKQLTNEFRVAPGSGVPIKTGGKPIGEVIANLPYKSPDAAFMAFIQHVEENGKALGGEASVPLNEGTANMPVGTMLAQIEQTLKPIKGVFKGLHRSQSEEFGLLKQRFREDPEALWRYNKKPARQWQVDEFLAALEMVELVPMADPNTSSQVQRVAIAWSMVELAEKAPYLFKEREVALRFMRMVGIPDPDGILGTMAEIQQKQAAMGRPPGKVDDPALVAAKVADLQAGAGLKTVQAQVAVHKAGTEGALTQAELEEKATERQFRAAEMLAQSQERDADRASHMTIAQINERTARLKAGADLATTAAKGHSAVEVAHAGHAHEAGFGAVKAVHEHVQGELDRRHEARQADLDQAHEIVLAQHQAQVAGVESEAERQHTAEQSDADRQQSASEGTATRDHQIKVAGMAAQTAVRTAAAKKAAAPRKKKP